MRVRVLRPARPQGALRVPCHRPRPLDGPRQRAGAPGRRRRLGADPGEPPRDLLRHPLRGPVGERPHPARRGRGRAARQGLAPGAPRSAGRGDARRPHGRPGPLRGALRHSLPVGRLPPRLRRRVQRRRDGEPRLRDDARGVPLPRRRDRRPAPPARQHLPPRDGAHVVRRPRDPPVVGRPLAQRVLRRVHGLPRPRGDDAVHRRVGRVRGLPQGVGLRGGALALDAPDRRLAGPRRALGAAELRRHLLRQGVHRDPAAHRDDRGRGLRPRHPRLPRDARPRRRYPRRLPRDDGAGRGGAARRVERRVARDGRRRHGRGRRRGGHGDAHASGGLPRRPDARARHRRVHRRRGGLAGPGPARRATRPRSPVWLRRRSSCRMPTTAPGRRPGSTTRRSPPCPTRSPACPT